MQTITIYLRHHGVIIITVAALAVAGAGGAVAAVTATAWTPTGTVYYNADNPTLPVIEDGNGYINTVTGYGGYTRSYYALPANGGNPELAWWTVDLAARFGPQFNTAKWVLVSGILIITNPTQETAIMDIAFAAPSSTVTTDSYMIRTEATGTPGVRVPFTTMIPLEGGRFKMWWDTPNCVDPWANRWPAHPSYGMNFSIQAYGT